MKVKLSESPNAIVIMFQYIYPRILRLRWTTF